MLPINCAFDRLLKTLKKTEQENMELMPNLDPKLAEMNKNKKKSIYLVKISYDDVFNIFVWKFMRNVFFCKNKIIRL